MRLLLLEDDETVAGPIYELMCSAGHETDWASNDYEAELSLQNGSYDLVLIALGFARLDALDMLRRYRHRGGSAPVIAMIGRNTHESPMAALDAGADDYLIKPFDPADFSARIRVLLRRPQQNADPRPDGDLKLDHTRCSVQVKTESVALKPSEFRLLFALVNEPLRIFTRAELAMRIYGRRKSVVNNAVDVHVHALRRKLGAEQIVTVRGVGYRLR
ncbi:DNA-binding response regulator [Paraburkholderia bannensis]|nr:response regulator transcription factor [Paraburkholderia bannensis]RQM45720.1 DNA-binding response regulator [Paraburkholderia bannensis]